MNYLDEKTMSFAEQYPRSEATDSLSLEYSPREEDSESQKVVGALEAYLDYTLEMRVINIRSTEELAEYRDRIAEYSNIEPAAIERVLKRMQLAGFADRVVLEHIRGGQLPSREQFSALLDGIIGNEATKAELQERFTHYIDFFTSDKEVRDGRVNLPASAILETYGDITDEEGEILDSARKLARLEAGVTSGAITLIETRASGGKKPEALTEVVRTLQLPFADVIVLDNMDMALNTPTEKPQRLAVNVEVHDPEYADLIDSQLPNMQWGQVIIPLYNSARGGQAWAYPEHNAEGRHLIVMPMHEVGNDEEDFTRLLVHEYRHVLFHKLFFDEARSVRPGQQATLEQYSMQDADKYLRLELHATSAAAQVHEIFSNYVIEVQNFIQRNSDASLQADNGNHTWETFMQTWKEVEAVITEFGDELDYMDASNVLHYAMALAENVDDVLESVSVALGYIRATA